MSRSLPSFEPPTSFGGALQLHATTLKENGLRLFVLPDASAPVVSYQTWFRVGSRNEVPGKTGISHLLEHLMFLGTKRHPEGSFDRLLESAGGENNAATWLDWTQYYENLPASELALAIELESDRLRDLGVSQAKFASERDVVISERRDRVEDDVDSAASELLFATLFGRKHPYGWPTLGWMKDIEGLTRADAQRYFRVHYAPNHAAIVVAGDVEPGDVLRHVHRAYASIPARTRPELDRPTFAPMRKEVQRSLRFATPTPKLLCGWSGPGYVERDHAVLFLAAQILTGGRSARLYQSLVRELELVQDVRVSVYPFQWASVVELFLAAREGKSIDAALAVADREIRALATKGPTPAELEKVKNRVELGFLGGMETAAGKAEQIGLGVSVAGDPAHAFVRLDELRSVTADDVRRVVKAHLAQPRARIDVVPTKAGRA